MSKKTVMAGIGLVAWTALVLQFYLILQSRATTGFSTVKTVTNFFSYFTILSNLLVAACVTSVLVAPASAMGKFFNKVTVQSAVAVYIFIVALVYNTVLRGIVTHSGFSGLVDNLLHVVIPILFVAYWLIFAPARTLQWKNLLPWLVFPAIYLVYSLLRGPVADWYPYPFLNADKLGYGSVAMNSLFVLAGFLVAGLGAITFNRRKDAER